MQPSVRIAFLPQASAFDVTRMRMPGYIQGSAGCSPEMQGQRCGLASVGWAAPTVPNMRSLAFVQMLF